MLLLRDGGDGLRGDSGGSGDWLDDSGGGSWWRCDGNGLVGRVEFGEQLLIARIDDGDTIVVVAHQRLVVQTNSFDAEPGALLSGSNLVFGGVGGDTKIVGVGGVGERSIGRVAEASSSLAVGRDLKI